MKSAELSLKEKEAIWKLKSKNNSIRAIAEKLGIPKSTIWNVIKKKELTGSFSSQPRCGRPRKTSAVTDRHIVRAV